MRNKAMWELKQSAALPGVLNLYIYSEVKGDSYDWWTDSVIESETSANHFREELSKHSDVSQINIYINSEGGSVYEGTAIYNQLKRHPAHKTVYIDGFACSIASVIAMAGDEIIMPKNALMMIHNMWMCAYGNAAELRKAADDLDIINTAGRAAYLEKAKGKIDEEKLIELMDAETWLNAEQCIEYGLADKYAEKEADMSGSLEILQKANLSLEQRIAVQKSLAAQLCELIKPEILEKNPKIPEVPPEKTPAHQTEKHTGSIMEMLAGFFID